jgi:hypothetical protein
MAFNLAFKGLIPNIITEKNGKKRNWREKQGLLRGYVNSRKPWSNHDSSKCFPAHGLASIVVTLGDEAPHVNSTVWTHKHSERT